MGKRRKRCKKPKRPTTHGDQPGTHSQENEVLNEKVSAKSPRTEEPGSDSWASKSFDADSPMTKILPFLYLGSQADSQNKKCLEENKITHILNLSVQCPESDHLLDDPAHYRRIPVNDDYTEKLQPYFEDCYDFVEMVRKCKGAVLLHCFAGISRSPTFAVSYIMRHLKISSDDAYKYIKQRRPQIAPNFNFLGQLLDYELLLRSKRILPPLKPEEIRKRDETHAAHTQKQMLPTSLSLSSELCEKVTSNEVQADPKVHRLPRPKTLFEIPRFSDHTCSPRGGAIPRPTSIFGLSSTARSPIGDTMRSNPLFAGFPDKFSTAPFQSCSNIRLRNQDDLHHHHQRPTGLKFENPFFASPSSNEA